MEIKFKWFHKYVHLYYVDGLHNYLKSRKEHFLNTHSNSNDLDYKEENIMLLLMILVLRVNY